VDSFPEFETLQYEERDGVAWVTLNRPERHNAFNSLMQRELHECWRALRWRETVRCVVLTGAGQKAFCTGIDRMEQMGGDTDDTTDATVVGSHGGTPFHFDDPGDNIGPKSSDLWKPVIAAVNGMACGGAFYMLGEVEFIIAADHATFFDPHVTYGQAAVYEPIMMRQHLSLGNVLRMSLLGARERISAQTALQIGLVTQVVPAAELAATAAWLGESVASLDPNVSAGTLRAVWAANDLGRLGALSMAPSILSTSIDKDVMRAGNEAFATQPRITPRVR
jgi:enoyl-CoA hydratase/carnithine racemase